MEKKQTCWVLTGPTASGKTALSIRLAKEFGCEIICMDSMQIYRGMNVGTAKPTEAEMDGVPHHMVDIADATDALLNFIALKIIYGKIDIRKMIAMKS